jgi:hypothetical protein
MMDTGAITMMDADLPYRIVTREDDVKQEDLNFENRIIHSRLRRFEKDVGGFGPIYKNGHEWSRKLSF